MQNRAIGFFDSGVGGISVLKRAIEIMPEESYIYFGDSLNAPYGTKSADEVFELTKNGIQGLIDKGVKAVVVACNTATSIAIDRLRKETDIPLISMEPAVKPALTYTEGSVLLMATCVTLSSERVNLLIDRLDTGKRVIKVACPELAKRIEDAAFGKDEIDEYLQKLLNGFLDKNVTAVVLGCTHYPFVKDRIISILGENISVYDGIDGTVQHLRDVLVEKNIKNTSEQKGSVELFSSQTAKQAMELYYKLLYGGSL